MIEMSLIVALIQREFHVRLESGQSITPVGSIALRPKEPIRLRLEPRR